MPRRYPQRPGWLGGDDLGENGSICRTGSTRLARRPRANELKTGLEFPCIKYCHSRSVHRLIAIPGVLDISVECSATCASLQRPWVTWVQVCNLGAISPASKVNLTPRDRAEIAYLDPGHPEALQAGGGRRALHGDIRNARDRWAATN